MAFILNFYPDISFTTRAILGTTATIIFLVMVELLEVNHDDVDIKEIFRPILFGLIITFVFIEINRLIEVLK